MKKYLVLPLNGASCVGFPTPPRLVAKHGDSSSKLEDFLNVMSSEWELVTIHYDMSLVYPLAVFTKREDI